MVRCYECIYYKGGKIHGKCTDNREGRKTIPVDSIDFCDNAIKKEGEIAK